jgi:hypothetical protein
MSDSQATGTSKEYSIDNMSGSFIKREKVVKIRQREANEKNYYRKNLPRCQMYYHAMIYWGPMLTFPQKRTNCSGVPEI